MCPLYKEWGRRKREGKKKKEKKGKKVWAVVVTHVVKYRWIIHCRNGAHQKRNSRTVSLSPQLHAFRTPLDRLAESQGRNRRRPGGLINDEADRWWAEVRLEAARGLTKSSTESDGAKVAALNKTSALIVPLNALQNTIRKACLFLTAYALSFPLSPVLLLWIKRNVIVWTKLCTRDQWQLLSVLLGCPASQMFATN